MNTSTLTRLSVFVVLLTVIASYGHVQAQTKRIVFTAKPAEDMLARAARLQVYPLQPPRLDRRTFDAQAEQLFRGELRGEAVQGNGTISLADTEKTSHFMSLELRTGYLSFNRGMADQIDDRPGKLPPDKEAEAIAREFLRKNDLGPGNPEEMELARIGHIKSSSFNPETGKKGPVLDQMVTVYFGRRLDGVPVTGSGSKMIVRIGDGGEVVGGARRWTERGRGRRLNREQLRSGDELMKDIRTFLSREMGESEEIRIVQFLLVYYDNGGKFIQPALAYEATVKGKELGFAYLGQTALLREPPERVGPEPVSREALQAIRKPSRDIKPPAKDAD
jgi:hypothetical protein